MLGFLKKKKKIFNKKMTVIQIPQSIFNFKKKRMLFYDYFFIKLIIISYQVKKFLVF